jgi:hypothetical protein
MTTVRRIIGQLVLLGGALASSAPSFVMAQSFPSVPGAPAPISAAGGEEGLRLLVDGVELEPISAYEIAGGNSIAQASPTLRAHAQGRTLKAEGGIEIGSTATVVRRELRGVWQYGRSAERSTRGEPRVRIELEGARGGSLVSAEDGVTRLPVRVLQMRTQKHAREGLEVFEGDLMLEIPVEALSKPGRYRGQLRITVEEI